MRWFKLFVVLTVIPKIALFTKPVEVMVMVKSPDYYFDSYYIDWQDGSRSFQGTVSDDPDDAWSGSFSRTHTYMRPGEYPVTVKLIRGGKVVKALSTMLSLKGVDDP